MIWQRLLLWSQISHIRFPRWSVDLRETSRRYDFRPLMRNTAWLEASHLNKTPQSSHVSRGGCGSALTMKISASDGGDAIFPFSRATTSASVDGPSLLCPSDGCNPRLRPPSRRKMAILQWRLKSAGCDSNALPCSCFVENSGDNLRRSLGAVCRPVLHD